MSNILLAMLFVFVFWAAAFYYLYIIEKRTDYGYQGRAAILALILILIPSVAITLVGQSQAKQQLTEQSFAVHENIGSSIGVAGGQGLSGDSWVFEFTGQDSEFAAFYRKPNNRPGWDLSSDNGAVLVFRKESQRMTVGVARGTAFFVLSED